MARIRTLLLIALIAFGLPAIARAQTAQADNQKQSHHVFWVLPAFNVDNQQQPGTLTSRQKLDIVIQGSTDPIGLGFKGFQAALEHSSSGFCGYGDGFGGYGKCYAAGLADGAVSGLVGDYAFASLFHQDPRYFRQGTGSGGSRLTYSLSQLVVRRQDSGRTAANTSLIGTVVAGAASNLYYPRAERGVGLTMTRIGWDLGGTMLFNLAAEFWPDVQHHLHHAPHASVKKDPTTDTTK